MSRKEKKEKKKKKKWFGKLVFLLLLAGVVYVGFKYFRNTIVAPIRDHLPSFMTEYLGTPTPTPIDLKGITLKCYGGEWDKFEEDDVHRNAKAEIEKKYNVVLENVNPWGGDREMSFMGLSDVLKNAAADGNPVVDIVNIQSDQLYGAFFAEVFPDITEYAKKLEVGAAYKSAGTWKDRIYGISYDKTRNAMLIVYDRYYIESLGLEQPYNLFVEGKWNYDDFEAYLRKMKAKLPEDVYPIGMDPYEWISMAAAANGTVLFDNNGEINLNDEAVIEAVEFYQKLETEKLAYPMTAEIVDGAIIDLDVVSGLEADNIVMKTSYFDALPEDKDKYGIVFWPWGSKVSCDEYYLKLSENYRIATNAWSIDAPIKIACEKKGVEPEVLTKLIYDYHVLCDAEKTEKMRKIWSAEKAGKTLDGTEVENMFGLTTLSILYEWGTERSLPDYSVGGAAFREAGYEVLCGYPEDVNGCLGEWKERAVEELANPFIVY